MNKIKNILTLVWYGTKIFLHLSGKKEKAKDMEDMEKNFNNKIL